VISVAAKKKPAKRKHKPSKRKSPSPKHKTRFFWVVPFAIFLGICFIIGSLVYGEMRSSEAQAKWLSWYGRQISFEMLPGNTAHVRYPKYGPYNERLGYSYMPFYIKALQTDDFTVAAQMRASDTYNDLLKHGLYPIYHPKTVAGLTLYDYNGEKIYAASYPNHVFSDFDQIPPLLVSTLLHIENRELLKDGPVTRNPVIEWNRLFYALFGRAAHDILHGSNAGGGSTLATQTEKFRFSPQGQTGSALEKLRQIASASLRVYLDGPDTREARKKIVLDYLNSTPLSARPSFGEINSIGDGLWAWFGIDLNDASAALNLHEDDANSLKLKATAYRAALGLVLAQRRPSYYLQSNRDALDELINAALDRLQEAGVISQALHDATKAASLTFLPEAPLPPEPPYIEQKAVNALRAHLMNLLGLNKLYEVDRLDLSGHTTLDRDAEQKLVEFLKKLGDKDFMQANGLYGFRLLNPNNDLAKIKWSVVLYERGTDSNKIRLQADTIDGPFDMNEGMKLDLGSTAKLRTLTTYLEIIAELHRRYAGLKADDLEDLEEDAPDNLTLWATGWLKTHPDADLETMLNASMERKYSGNPGEVFFTGSGAHVFHNFERSEDFEIMDLHEAFRRSVNLVFVRVMRDIVNYTIAQGPQTKDELLDNEDDAEDAARQAYLERFADQEGTTFLNHAIANYSGLMPEARLEKLVATSHKGAVARTVLFRSMMPDADYQTYVTFMQTHTLREQVSAARLAKLYRDYAIDKYSLADRAYLTGVHPMELWLLSYWPQHPQATRRELVEVSRPERISSYAWLFKASKKRAQDTRIGIMLEEDAFAHIQKRWARLGYPFDHLVPSYATAIGSSADRPGALAELVGIILADGKKMPVERFESLEFGVGTPYQTLLKVSPQAQPQQVLSPAIAHVMKDVMSEVVENGTAKRAKGVYRDADGKLLPVGGKTGTGDQRFDEFSVGGHLVSSRVVNRTGTFVFYIGDRFFGTITAHVAGEDAADYAFTSALSAQMLRALAPIINPVVSGATQAADDVSPPVGLSQPLPP
jgi:membrane peptidoglycan carboxypeptidase